MCDMTTAGTLRDDLDPRVALTTDTMSVWSGWRPDTTLSWGTSPAVTAVPAPWVDPDTSLPLAHLSIAGEVRMPPCVRGSPHP